MKEKILPSEIRRVLSSLALGVIGAFVMNATFGESPRTATVYCAIAVLIGGLGAPVKNPIGNWIVYVLMLVMQLYLAKNALIGAAANHSPNQFLGAVFALIGSFVGWVLAYQCKYPLQEPPLSWFYKIYADFAASDENVTGEGVQRGIALLGKEFPKLLSQLTWHDFARSAASPYEVIVSKFADSRQADQYLRAWMLKHCKMSVCEADLEKHFGFASKDPRSVKKLMRAWRAALWLRSKAN